MYGRKSRNYSTRISYLNKIKCNDKYSQSFVVQADSHIGIINKLVNRKESVVGLCALG